MTIRLSTADSNFEALFTELLATKREVSEEVGTVVAEVIARVREEGDRAVIDYTRRFDRFDPSTTGLRITRKEIAAAYETVDRPTLEALKIARERIESHHARQTPSDLRYRDDVGV